MTAGHRRARWASRAKIALIIVAGIIALPFTVAALLAGAKAERR